MKNKISVVILVLLVAILGLLLRTGFDGRKEVAKGKLQPSIVPIVSGENKGEEPASINQGNLIKTVEYSKPKAGFLRVWNYIGDVDQDLISQYGLTDLQVTQLKDLRKEAIERIRRMDSRNAVVVISPDRRTMSVEIKPYPEEARRYSDFLMDRIAAVMGKDAYADLANYMSLPLGDDVCLAGLTTKKIEIEKLPPSANGVQYKLKYIRELQGTSVSGALPPPNSVTTEATVSREKVGTLCYVAPAVMPSDF